MPIKQERVLGLLAAARDLQGGLEGLCAAVQAEGGRAAAGSLDPSEALANLMALASPLHLLTNPLATIGTIERETGHFSPATLSRNAASRKRALLRRAGTNPPTSTPPLNEWGSTLPPPVAHPHELTVTPSTTDDDLLAAVTSQTQITGDDNY